MNKKKTTGQIRRSKTCEFGSRKSQVAVMNKVVHGTAEDLIPHLGDGSINLVVTSPPYAEQRKKQYGGVPEKEYPEWMAGVMRRLRPKMAWDGNVVINIKPHVRNGQVSDYVLRTRLAVREAGWCEIDELIWLSPDKPPLGRTVDRPRRTWEHLLWFSPSNRPYIDVRACSKGTANWSAGRTRAKNHLVHGKQVFKFLNEKKKPRITDIVTASIGGIDQGIMHPAMYPRALPEHLIQTFSRPGDLVADVFAGSGTTLLVAQSLGRRFWGCDQSPEYTEMARRRLAAERPTCRSSRRA